VTIETSLTKPATANALRDAINEALGRKVREPESSSNRHELRHEAMETLSGAQVLLVEDNEINQELALELLAKGGVTVRVAENGRAALDILDSGQPFDGVLMDVQMPVMDGYTATREIRKRERLRNLPVIAMTANVMASDLEKANAAGMNDHIGKPIDVKEMFTTMARWITPATRQPKVQRDAETEETPDLAIPDLPGIDTKAGLAVAQGNRKLYVRLLRRFRDREGEFVDRFSVARSTDDRDSATRLAHTLKGVAGSLGAVHLQGLAADLERVCAEDWHGQGVDEPLKRIGDVLPAVLSGISALDAGQESTCAQFHSTLDLDNGLNRLQALLEESDGDALELMEELLTHPLLAEQSPEVQQLSASVADYDFDAALQNLERFRARLTPKLA
jgi:polar amino acid transport system substrate-binding protein